MASALSNIAIAHYVASNYDSAIYFTNKSIEIDIAMNDLEDAHKSYNNLGVFYEAVGDFGNAKKSYEKSLQLKEVKHDSLGIANTYNNLSGLFSALGEYKSMISADINALKIREKLKDEIGLCKSYVNLALDYIKLNDYKESQLYAEKGLELALKLEDKYMISLSHSALGMAYVAQRKMTKARFELNEAAKIASTLGDLKTASDCYNNVAKSYSMEGNYVEAQLWLNKSLKNARKIDAKYEIMYTLHQLGNNSNNQKKYQQALVYFNEALPIAKSENALTDLEIIYKGMQEAYAGLGNYSSVYNYSLLYNSVHDSLNNENKMKQLSFIRTEFETEKKEHQIDLLNKDKEIQIKEISKQKLIRNYTIAGLGALAIFLVVVLIQKRKITKEKDRSENLLLNILPYETAQELKEKGSADAKLYDEVTVLFTDFKGFTQVAEKLSPSELVEEIHHCFKAFDEIMSEHNIEKIKTIGDAYMAAGGLPVKNKTNAKDVIDAAIKIQLFMNNYKLTREANGKSVFEIRIGIHTGPVIAGIVGIKKFQYDIWGDTVNTASRMESSGEAGKINVSGATYQLVKNDFICTYRGKILAKNKGEIDMYFVEPKNISKAV